MSLSIAHFAFGATMTTILVTMFPRARYPHTVIVAGGVWATIPDLHWLSPIAEEQLKEFHRTSALVDLFWLHGTMDRLDPGDSMEMAVGLVAVYFLVTVIAERRGYRSPAPASAADETASDPPR